MIVKVCGMRNAENIRQLDEARIADWMGFIFYPKSPRYASERPTYLPRYSQRVGVFVNASADDYHSLSKSTYSYYADLLQYVGYVS